MDVEIPVLSGNLNIPTQSGFSLNRISKKKSGQRYCLLFKSSRHGIERLEICESKDDKNPKIITLEDCVKITQESSPVNSIQIVKKTGTLTLNALTDEDLKEWITALQSVAFRDKGGGTLGRNAAIEEHNDLYCSSYGDGLFSITLIPSETSIRCNLESKVYMLHLTATELQLKSAEDLNIIVAKWPYRYIRKYGYRNGNFTFEAGRKCDTGEGGFILDHTNPQDVFRCMASKMKSMKKLINGESLNSLDCGENQLSAALSMEPGSRSPLPPSPNLLNHSDFDIANTSLTQSCASIRDFLSSNDSLNNVSTSSTATIPITKHIPSKPPRKDLKPQQSNDSQKKSQKYDPVTITNDPAKSIGSVVVLKAPSPLKPIVDQNVPGTPNTPPSLPVRNDNKKPDRDYESIETITDAWRTLGLGEVKHTEHIAIPEDDLIDFVWQRTQSQRGENNRNNLIIDDIDPNGTYDRLDFMPPNSKNNSNLSNQYKTIVTVAPPGYKKQHSAPPVPNDYELIENPDMQACRLADDSYLGYGVLRKPSIPGPQVATANKNVSTTMITEDPSLDHRSYNGLNYAIVSKPKRV